MTRNISIVIGVVTCLLAAGCGASERSSNDVVANGSASGGDDAATPVAVPNACTFFTRAELEAAVGWELRDGEPKDVSAGSSCSFESPPTMYAKRNFPNPPLPSSAGFSALTITTHPSAAASFAQGKASPGAEPVSGLGDDAYFDGANLLHVRVGGRGFSIRIYTESASPADAAKIHAVMLSLGKAGASRL